ncbi:N2,N2-dimethylguanosine tRNA methyltransferase [Synechococcus sp. CBW1107]|uniref:N2,N2-dimethylguanosine tRNA methyltransferase n=1 Tax=Synechococcus sp. CBW1107 TaxID=2789857 RepID=UPI002AD2227E|nr:N2,N2-dimethylguanosine tRNA methyltransferase [Synechococcus sp. CBW1107]
MSRSHACDPTAESPQRHGPQLHREGAVELDLGGGFFRPESRPSRDLGVLLAAWLARRGTGTLRVLDGMAGSGIRALRYGTEAGATSVWANDADPDRLPLLERNLAGLSARGVALRVTVRTVQVLLAEALIGQERFDLVDLDAFGCPAALVPLALEAVAFDGVLYLASTDGRSPTGHDRPAAVRRLGAAARAHPSSWELALRLQLGVIARAAWALGRGVQPLFSFSEGRTFRTAVRLRRRAAPGEESRLGLLALCHGCGDQQVQSLLQLRRWAACLCQQAPTGEPTPLAISGPLWIGPLQDPAALGAMAPGAETPALEGVLEPASLKLLRRLQADPAAVARCWPTAEIARRLGGGPPRLEAMIQHLRQRGHGAWASGVMAAQLRSDAPWPVLLEVARAAQAGTLLNRFGLRSSPGHGL